MVTRVSTWFAARDPGYVRLYAATRVTLAALATVILTALLLKALNQWAMSILLFAMLVTFFSLQVVNDAQPQARRRSLALAVLPIAGAILVTALLPDLFVLQAVALVVSLFVAFYLRRYGVRAGELALLGALILFFAAKSGLTRENFGIFLMAAAIGVASAFVFLFFIMPYRPLRALRQAVLAFYERASEVVTHLRDDLEQPTEAQREKRLRTNVRQLGETRRVIENLAVAIISPSEWTGERLARLELDLYNSEQALGVMVESAARLDAARQALPEDLKRAMIDTLNALLHALHERVSPDSAAAAAQSFEHLRQQFRTSAVNAGDHAWVQPCVAFAVGGAQLGRAARSMRENDLREWHEARAAGTPALRGADKSANLIPFAGRRLHVTTVLGIQAALASALALLAAWLLGIPNPLVAFLSAFLVVSTTAGESVRRAWLRVLGTIGGVIVGLIVGELAPDNFVVVLALSAAAVFMAVYVTAVSYNWMVFWITVAVMQPLSLAAGLNSDVGLMRIINITIGAAAAAVVANTVFPLQTRTRFNAALANFLGAVDQLVAQFVSNLTQGQSSALDAQEYAVSTAFAKLSNFLSAASYEYSALSQRRNRFQEQTTQLSALHDYVTHLADEIEIEGGAIEDDARRTVLSTLQTNIHENIQVIIQRLKTRGAVSLQLKRENIGEVEGTQNLVTTTTPTHAGPVAIAIGRLARIRATILELGTQQGIQTA